MTETAGVRLPQLPRDVGRREGQDLDTFGEWLEELAVVGVDAQVDLGVREDTRQIGGDARRDAGRDVAAGGFGCGDLAEDGDRMADRSRGQLVIEASEAVGIGAVAEVGPGHWGAQAWVLDRELGDVVRVVAVQGQELRDSGGTRDGRREDGLDGPDLEVDRIGGRREDRRPRWRQEGGLGVGGGGEYQAQLEAAGLQLGQALGAASDGMEGVIGAQRAALKMLGGAALLPTPWPTRSARRG
ncbi:hypothetical protein OG369_39320 [Streptomyces sp. NBC_01221]|uniref:hypothetical protein n=1 Tax=Streptomyces sp. NBC_01221 TaxID=2903782 RepID=UPI002257C371|nr:hypothetical protein [Streptomyces sp. NBC_01221]MCX4791911.1 hypothetical protein [Streptomyces sp. NBC_01221]